MAESSCQGPRYLTEGRRVVGIRTLVQGDGEVLGVSGELLDGLGRYWNGSGRGGRQPSAPKVMMTTTVARGQIERKVDGTAGSGRTDSGRRTVDR